MNKKDELEAKMLRRRKGVEEAVARGWTKQEIGIEIECSGQNINSLITKHTPYSGKGDRLDDWLDAHIFDTTKNRQWGATIGERDSVTDLADDVMGSCMILKNTTFSYARRLDILCDHIGTAVRLGLELRDIDKPKAPVSGA